MAAQNGHSHRNAVSLLQVTEAVKFLASKVPEPPDLRRQPLGDLVEDVLAQHFFTPVLQDLKRRQQLGKLHPVGLPVPSCVVRACESVLVYGVCVVYVCTGPQCSDWSVQQQDVKTQLLTNPSMVALQAPNAVIGLYNSRMLKSSY